MIDDGLKLQKLIESRRRKLARARWWQVTLFRLAVFAAAIGGVIL